MIIVGPRSPGTQETSPNTRARQRPLSSATVAAQGHAAELDHVLVAVTDLAAAARAIEDEHGLRAEEGGRHPGWGTAICIVPLGDAYLELVTAVDQQRLLTARSGDG